jgi:hypothetical protein
MCVYIVSFLRQVHIFRIMKLSNEKIILDSYLSNELCIYWTVCFNYPARSTVHADNLQFVDVLIDMVCIVVLIYFVAFILCMLYMVTWVLVSMHATK